MFSARLKILKPIFILVSVLLMLMISVWPADAAGSSPKKAVVLIMDNLSFSDLLDARYTNFHQIIKDGGIGLMNSRTGSIVEADRASAYLSIGMGIRAHVPQADHVLSLVYRPSSGRPGAAQGFVRLLNERSEALNEFISREYPQYIPGKLAETAKSYGLKVALIGNADTDIPHSEAMFMAADIKGTVEMGSMGRELLKRDARFLGGSRTDTEQLYRYTIEAVKNNDIIFVEYADLFRLNESRRSNNFPENIFLEMKQGVLREADKFVGRLLNSENRQDLVFIVISPTLPPSSVYSVNRNLAPIIIYRQDQPAGVLTSNTTRLDGIVSNIDIAPTLFRELGYEGNLNFLGEAITTIPKNNNMQIVSDNLSGYITLKKSRYGIHAIYVVLLVMALAILFLPMFKSTRAVPAVVRRAFAAMVVVLPAAGYIVPVLFKINTYYEMIAIIGLVTVAAGVLMSKNDARTLCGMALVSMITAVFIITDLLLGTQLLLHTPLGFDDVFMGGRYCGINNDSMGILLGSTVFATFYWLERLKLNRFFTVLTGSAVFMAVILSQSPGFGANVGGTIAAMTTGVIAITFLISGKPINYKQVAVTVVLVFVVELVIAYIDYRSGGPTHAGKVMGTLLTQGFGIKFMEVLKSKLSLFGLMLVLPPYNILGAVQIYLFFVVKTRLSDYLRDLSVQFSLFSGWREVIFYGGLVAFVFNDTGVIATALMFTYLTMPLGVLINSSSGIQIHINRKDIKEIF